MISSTVRKKLSMAIAVAAFVALAIVGKGQAVVSSVKAAQLIPPFSSSYSLINLGSIRELPPAYGGLTFNPKDPDTLLIGGLADSPDSEIYSVRVKRNRSNHIKGFDAASPFAKARGVGVGGIDAGLTYNPKGDVLFYTSYDDKGISQIKVGSKAPNKQINLNSLGISSSVGALGFVPEGFVGAGRLKISSYVANLLYDTTITPDGSGTYNIAAPSKSTKLSGGIDSFVYIKAGNPRFSKNSLLMAEYDTNKISAYTLDAKEEPIAATRRDFITGISAHSPTALTGIIGATVDPMTGDVLFSTFFEDDSSKSKIFAVRGFRK